MFQTRFGMFYLEIGIPKNVRTTGQRSPSRAVIQTLVISTHSVDRTTLTLYT